MHDYLEEQDRIIAEYEADAEEAAVASFEALLEETAGPLVKSKSGLLNKLALFPNGDFPVSLYSQYHYTTWTLTDEAKGGAVRITFELEVLGLSDLKRALVYHLLPAFTPFTRMKSFSSSRAKAHDFRFIDMYLLRPNRLCAVREHLQLITLPMLNKALDDAKNSGKSSHYTGLFFSLRFWSALSGHQLIPVELRLSPELSGIESKERYRDVVDTFSGSIQTWIPFSEAELEKLVNYSLFWIDEAAPRLIDSQNFLIKKGFDKFNKGVVRRTKRQHDMEDAVSITINGVPVLDYSMIEGFHNGYYVYTYRWVSQFAQTIDKVRNAVFVFVALVTGMRKNELAVLTFDDVSADEAGQYWIDITRFKTSSDPNYSGETERLPLPRFVGESVEKLKKLRKFWTFYKDALIFQTVFSVKPVTNVRPTLPITILLALEAETGIDRIHAHRFRKTIAEILIHRNERNIDLIRLLFGHRSYSMTLQYISRNPYLVRSVAVALEESYSKEFHEIVTAVRDGSFSGSAADRLARQISLRPDDFKGKKLKVSILVYVSHLLSAGSPIYVGRTAVGTYCISAHEFDEANLPPCLVGRKLPEDKIRPDPNNCQIECRNAVVVAKAENALRENLRFYESLMKNEDSSISARASKRIHEKIEIHKRHLRNLHSTETIKMLRIPVLEVS